MLAATIYNENTGPVNTGGIATVSTKTTVIGLCTVEIVNNNNPDLTITIQGKLFNSNAADVDSGWVDVVEFSKLISTGIDTQVVGKAIGIFTFMRVKVVNNSGNANIQVSVGYN